MTRKTWGAPCARICACLWMLGLGFMLMSGGAYSQPPLSSLTSEQCAGCHAEIYKQWKGSMHGNSSALRDPIHGAFYRQVIGDPRQEGVRTKSGKYPVCLQCHVPEAAKAGKTKLDAVPQFADGIGCVSCHTLKSFKGVKQPDGSLKLGVQAYEISDVHLQGPSGRSFTNTPGPGVQFHPFPIQGNQAVMKTNDACMGCHDQRNNSKGVALCQSGDEIFASGSEVSCQSCHMPKVNGIADHSMLGGHSAEMVEGALLMTVDARSGDGDTVVAEVTLKNLLPHNLPTGAPFRNIVIKVTAFDGAGRPVWQNFVTDPVTEDSQSILKYTLGGPDGKPAPPPKATQVLSDTRLTPHEERVLTYRIPIADAVMVRAEAFYNLLWANLVKKLGPVLTPDLSAPKPIGTAETAV